MTTQTAAHEVVSSQDWLLARKELLAKEKELTRLHDDLSRQRRELPWERVDKSYVFDGPNGKQSLADLFAGRSQLIVYHFMFGPDWPEGCPSCSMAADHFDGSLAHLAARDVTLAVVSRAPWSRIEPFRQRMGWRFPWVSSFGNDFNRDYKASFTPEEMAQGNMPYNFGTSASPSPEAHGVSVFAKDEDGKIFHTYSTYGRGLEELLGVYTYFDWTAKGRNEGGLPYPMAWVRHHDRYEEKPATAACCSGEEKR